MADAVHELVATERALEKLGARSISVDEAAQLPRNRYIIVRNARDPGRRRFLIGSTDGGRILTLVIESSPGTWCRSSPLSSSVRSLAAQAAMSSTSLSLLSREISFSDPRSLRVAIDFWLM